MPDTLYPRLCFSGLDDALDRFRSFARAHPDFEPTLTCERVGRSRRRWVLTVLWRNSGDLVGGWNGDEAASVDDDGAGRGS